jgi:PAS domain-containing protein
MRINLPVSNNEYDYPGEELLMSTTDAKGVMTHCNAAFARVSGYSMEELMGQPHNMVRHPDMPREAFADMWATLKAGQSWTALVKNRRKDVWRDKQDVDHNHVHTISQAFEDHLKAMQSSRGQPLEIEYAPVPLEAAE